MPSSLSLLNKYVSSSPLLSTSPSIVVVAIIYSLLHPYSLHVPDHTRPHFQEITFSFRLLLSSLHDHPDHLKHPNQTDQSDHSDKQEDKCRIRIVYFVFSKFHKSRDSLSRLHFCATNICSTGREQQNNLAF